MLNKRTVIDALALICLVCVVSLWPSNVRAESCKEAHALLSPCEGVLLPRELALEGLQAIADVPRLRLDIERLKLEITSTEQLCSQDKEYLAGLIKQEERKNEYYSGIIFNLRGEVQRLEETTMKEVHWYDTRTFWFGLGASVTIVFALAVVLLQ